MSKGVEFISDDIALIQGGEVLVVTGEPVNLDPLRESPKSPRIKEENTGDAVAYWGEENDFPQRVIKAAERSTELPSLLDWMARALQGREVLPFTKRWDAEKEKLVYDFVDDPEILDFLGDETFKRYMREASTDFFWFWNVFPELIKSVDGDKIAYLGTQDASWCRWAKMDRSGVVRQCFINANWPDAKADDPETIKMDVVDPYSNTRVEDVRTSKNDSFIYPTSYPSPGKVYYQLSKWNGYLTTGWYHIARSIPTAKKNQMERIFAAKYKLVIPVTYWPAVYKDWAKMSPSDQRDEKKKKVLEINKQLIGPDNEGKIVFTENGKDAQGNDIPAWDIIPIERNKIDGEHLEDSRETSEHLMRALLLDPTLVGDGPGKKMGSGSGSDKRVAFNIYVALQQPYRDVILEPLNFIALYNGWKDRHRGLVFRTVEIGLETLDKSHSTSKETTN